MLLEASGPAPPSPGLSALHSVPTSGPAPPFPGLPALHSVPTQASFLGPLPLFAALSLLRWGDQAAPFPQLSLIFLSSPL